MTIYSGFTHWKWWFSIVMLVYERVIKPSISIRNDVQEFPNQNSIEFPNKTINLQQTHHISAEPRKGLLPGNHLRWQVNPPSVEIWPLQPWWYNPLIDLMILPIGSMVLVYRLTWLGYIDGIHVTIYSSTMDPMGYEWNCTPKSVSGGFFWG